MVRCMLKDANLPNKFSGEALVTANYLQNRIFTRSINKTPYELWNDRKPNLKYLNVFGSSCYVKVHKRRKLDDTSRKMIFLGYDNNGVLKCYDTDTQRIVYSRDVNFHRQDFEVTFTTKDRDCQSDVIEISSTSSSSNTSSSSTSSSSTDSNINHETTIWDDIINSDSDDTPAPIPRRSHRSNKGVPPKRYGYGITTNSVNSIVSPQNFNQAMNDINKEEWLQAMQDEFDSLKKNQTWILCKLPPDRVAVGSKWIYNVKTDDKGNIDRYKARLVAQGFSQQFGIDYNDVFAPVARQATLRILLSIASKEKFFVKHLDVKTAFLNGKLQETIYMKQPKGFEEVDKEDYVCLLKRSLYGLKQAPKVWNDVVNQMISKLGFKRNRGDPCLYQKKLDNGDECMLLIYVDDILLVSNSTGMMNNVKNEISILFEIRDLGEPKYYLRIEINKNGDIYNMSQANYIQQLVDEYNMTDARISKIPIDVSYGKTLKIVPLESNAIYQKLIGSLLYLAINTRPDISTAVCILSQKTSEPSTEDWNELKRVLRYLKGTKDFKLFLTDNTEQPELIGYADANYICRR